MDIKEVSQPQTTSQATEQPRPRKQKPLTALSSAQVRSAQPESEAVEVESSRRASSEAKWRTQTNEVITITNLAAEATAAIEKLVESIGGMAEQAVDQATSGQQRGILEGEANELLGEIKRTALTAGTHSVHPLAGDKVRLEVEEKLGKTLEFLLPDDATRGFDIGKIAFSTKESIISTIANITTAQQSIERLRDAVSRGTDDVKETVACYGGCNPQC